MLNAQYTGDTEDRGMEREKDAHIIMCEKREAESLNKPGAQKNEIYIYRW